MAIPYMQAEGLSKSFGVLHLFSDISFGINRGERVGLIARNGTGKSTLLNILAGCETADKGRVVYKNDLRTGYLPQNPRFPSGLTVIEACFHDGNPVARLIKEYEQCIQNDNNPELGELLARMDQYKAWDYEHKIKTILSKLRITNYHQKVDELSGGQIKRVALANILITEPEFLILDEPTNHLDVEMTEWLEEYLGRGGMTLLMVTHDRYFLDRVCDSIIEIDDGTTYTYQGNYAYYLEKRRERIENMAAETEKAKNLYRTELDWMRRMPQARGHKAKYREDAFYELQKVAKRHKIENDVRLEVQSSYIGKKIFEADKLCKKYGEKTILEDFSYIFSRYEKMGIVGDNGTGKSTFIKILTGIVSPDSGNLDIGQTVRFGYFAQQGMKFDEDMRVIDAVRDIAEVVETGSGQMSAGNFLQHFLFSPEKQYDYVYKLSGGEKRRLYLCTVLMRSPNFLVLDEPTNDLDIATLRVLEDYLRSFKGCLIVISHDRYFMDRVVDHLLVFNGNGDIRDFPGNYSQYREWKRQKEQHEKEQRRIEAERITRQSQDKSENEPSHQRKKTYREQQEYQQIEEQIGQLEKEKEQIETSLAGGTLTVEEITNMSKRLPELTEKLDELEYRWLELSELD